MSSRPSEFLTYPRRTNFKLINQEVMASIIARIQYPAVRTTKNVFWTRDKYCCAVFFSNLSPEKSTHKGIKNSSLAANDPNNGPKTMSDTKYPSTIKEKQILRYLVNELKVKEEKVWNEILKHPKRKFLKICQIQNSLKYLQHQGFSKQVIADLPAICFYPQGNIETGLEEVTRNSVELFKLGYANGFVEDETPGFLCGSKSKDKRLHLCLYYMELPFDFNGNGIFSIDGYSDLPSSET